MLCKFLQINGSPVFLGLPDAKAQGICQDGSKSLSDFNANIVAHVAMADYKYNGHFVQKRVNRYMRFAL